ncbi:MAG: glycosyltransferase family 9 protein [Bacteroidota bacterium]
MTAVKPIAEKSESIRVVPWIDSTPPQKILSIRLQALGDTVITLPYLQSLHNRWPSTLFHFLTREEFGDLPRNMKMFDAVFTIGGGRDRVRQFLDAVRLLPQLQKEKYDVVIDLQRNMLSRTVRRMVRPKSFSEFDRFSLNSAGERTRRTINNLLPQPMAELLPLLELRENYHSLNALIASGYNTSKKLIVLNPAGSFITRNWPLDCFLEFAHGWITHVDDASQFLILGTEGLREKALFLKENLGDKLINLVGKTSPSEAFAILQKAELVVSEDSGLMHMAWVAQVPVVALFGSSRSAWSKPLGKWSVCLASSDLECGECLQPACRFGDVHCLSRYTPGFVIETAKKLLERKYQSGE